MKLRASLAAVVAFVLVVVVAPAATGKGAGGIPQATSNIPGCAPQCLPPGKAVPGSLPTGTYQTQYFFAKQMKLSFAPGWFSEEDSTGEFAAYAKKNREFACRLLGGRLHRKGDDSWVLATGRPVTPNSGESFRLAPKQPQSDGVQADQRQDWDSTCPRCGHRCRGRCSER
jgi:hypothetical protein